MDLGIQEKHALVTGGGRGIGKAIALALAAEGVKVTLIARTESELKAVCETIQANGGQAAYALFDLVKGDPEALRTQIEAGLGPVDILVGNAAKTSKPKKLTHMESDDWYQTIETDLNGTYRMLKTFLPGLQERRWGRIILIGSLSGMVGVSAYPAYCAVKAAYEGLVKNLAVDYSKYGLTVNLVSPGFVETERFKAAAPPQLIEKFKQVTASKRLAQPEDVANAVCFLASEKATYLTGVNLPVCGGLNLGNLW